MPHLVILVHATADAAVSHGAACAARGLDVDVLPVLSPHEGQSKAYDALARECLSGGRLLPGLLRRFRPPRQRYDSIWLVCWSAGYALARALSPADRDEFTGLILLDSGHTTLESDGTALDAGVQWAVEWATEAREGRKVFVIAHTDVRTYGATASTTQFAREVERLAGGQRGDFHVEAMDVSSDDRAEHIASLRGWGPMMVADAMGSVLAPGAPPWKGPEPVELLPETQRKPGRLLRQGDHGDDVTAWAQRLLDLGYDPGGLDGVFGLALDRATRELQRDTGLVVDGVVGPKTRGAADAARPKPARPAPPKGLGEAMLARARADLAAGVRETAPNDGPRIREYLETCGVAPPANCCAAAVTTWMREAAADLHAEPPILGSAGAQVLMHQLKKAGRWYSAAQLLREPSLLRPGMIGVLQRGMPGSWMGHAFLVDGPVEGTLFPTVEANSGPQGDRVAAMRRDLRDPRFFGAGWID